MIREILFPIVFYITLNFGLTFFLKRRFGEVVPFSFIISALFMYISQYLFKTFDIGLYVLLGISVLLVSIVLILNKRSGSRNNDDEKSIIDISFNSGFIALIVIFIVVSVYDYHRPFTDFDEFWHWGMMVKESLRLDKFYAIGASRQIIHKDYPPFLSLIEVLWCKLAGRYSEGIATTGLHVFTISMLVCPLIEYLTKEEKHKSFKRILGVLLKSLLLIIFIACITSSFDNAHIGNTLLADIPMAYLFAYLLLLVISEKVFNDTFAIVCFIAASIALVMTKQVGVALLMVVICFYTLYGMLKKQLCSKSVFFMILGLMFPVGFYMSWNSFVKQQNINDIRGSGGSGQFAMSKIDIRDYIDAVLGNSDELKVNTFRNLIKSFFYRNIADIGITNITFITALLLLLTLVLVLYRLNSDVISREKAISLCVSFVIGFAGYAFMLSVMFLFCFTEDEMVELRGYERYIDGFLLGMILAIAISFLIVLYDKKRINSNWSILIIVMAFAILFNGSNLQYLLPQITRDGNFYKEYADIIRDKTEIDSTVKIIYDSKESWYGYIQSYLQYYLNDRDIPWGTNYYSANFEEEEVRNSIIDEIKNIDDYIYFIEVNDILKSNLGPHTDDGELYTGLYSVKPDGNDFKLIYVD